MSNSTNKVVYTSFLQGLEEVYSITMDGTTYINTDYSGGETKRVLYKKDESGKPCFEDIQGGAEHA